MMLKDNCAILEKELQVRRSEVYECGEHSARQQTRPAVFGMGCSHFRR